ncbi:protein-disulfide isomerase [Rhizomicrobium palustre]|uniref:Protein-disulfide isomerase n=1 Tax=Rhizomicrobium palustre TaxID=189966 RepID=A0A846N4P7_9PROT|nr:thioredoxin domain-containing protein [Rhizomicrobium palustre]NIK90171.1 protein-disulfide isomerase [Rhizomicrobium palustre]
MSLKDRLSEALAATPAENTRRIDTLKAALNAGEHESDIAEALTRLIEARVTRAVALEHEGQTEQAARERAEISSLQTLLAGEQPVALPGTKGASKSGKGGALISRNQMVFGGIGLLALGALVYALVRPSEDTDTSAAQNTAAISIYKEDHTLGNPKAPITIVEYAAPVCPVCARFSNEEFPILKREFIDTGRVFYIFRVFPIRAQDGAIEGIARCLPKERYFPYIEMMFREQPQWDPDGYDIPDVEGAIVKLAAREGLSPERARQCMADPATQESVNQMAQDAQLKYQIEGTPTFIMNGQVVNFPPGNQRRIDVLRMRINSLSGSSNP